MRQFILIAAIVLTSASAWADGPRGLSLAANGEATAAGQPQRSEPIKAEASNTAASKAETSKAEISKEGAAKVVDRSSADDFVPEQPKTDGVRPDQTKSFASRTEKPKHKRDPLEARVIDELHRHGIYW